LANRHSVLLEVLLYLNSHFVFKFEGEKIKLIAATFYKPPSFVLNEVSSIDFSKLSDDVFGDGSEVGPGASIPKVIVKDFGSCSKVDEVGEGLVI